MSTPSLHEDVLSVIIQEVDYTTIPILVRVSKLFRHIVEKLKFVLYSRWVERLLPGRIQKHLPTLTVKDLIHDTYLVHPTTKSLRIHNPVSLLLRALQKRYSEEECMSYAVAIELMHEDRGLSDLMNVSILAWKYGYISLLRMLYRKLEASALSILISFLLTDLGDNMGLHMPRMNIMIYIPRVVMFLQSYVKWESIHDYARVTFMVSSYSNNYKNQFLEGMMCESIVLWENPYTQAGFTVVNYMTEKELQRVNREGFRIPLGCVPKPNNRHFCIDCRVLDTVDMSNFNPNKVDDVVSLLRFHPQHSLDFPDIKTKGNCEYLPSTRPFYLRVFNSK